MFSSCQYGTKWSVIWSVLKRWPDLACSSPTKLDPYAWATGGMSVVCIWGVTQKGVLRFEYEALDCVAC